MLGAQRHALETLALSERRGCALGATTALVADWGAIRARARPRRGAHGRRRARLLRCPTRASVVAVIRRRRSTRPRPSARLAFGAEQLLLQNRGLFDLLEARADARGDD